MSLVANAMPNELGFGRPDRQNPTGPSGHFERRRDVPGGMCDKGHHLPFIAAATPWDTTP